MDSRFRGNDGSWGGLGSFIALAGRTQSLGSAGATRMPGWRSVQR